MRFAQTVGDIVTVSIDSSCVNSNFTTSRFPSLATYEGEVRYQGDYVGIVKSLTIGGCSQKTGLPRRVIQCNPHIQAQTGTYAHRRGSRQL